MSFATNSSPNAASSSAKDFDIRDAFTAGVTLQPALAGIEQDSIRCFGRLVGGQFHSRENGAAVDVVGAIEFTQSIALYPRPNVVPGVPLVHYGSEDPGGKASNPAAFTPAPTGQQGDFGRNVLRGFGAWQADVAFQRQFRLTEKVGLRLRGEFFNLNHPTFGNPDNTLGDPLFGQSTQTLASSLGSGGANGGFNPLYQIGGPRSTELALRLHF